MVVVPSNVDSVFFMREKYPFRWYFISLFVCPSNTVCLLRCPVRTYYICVRFVEMVARSRSSI